MTRSLTLKLAVAAALSCGVVVLAPHTVAAGDDVPPARMLLVTAAITAAICSALLFWGLRSDLRLPVRAALYAVVFNVLVIVVKLGLAPRGFYEVNQQHDIDSTFAIDNSIMAVLAAACIFALYLIVFAVLFKAYQAKVKHLGSDDPIPDFVRGRNVAVGVVVLTVLLVATGGAILLLLLPLAAGLTYVQFVFESSLSLVVGVLLACATAFAHASVRDRVRGARVELDGGAGARRRRRPVVPELLLGRPVLPRPLPRAVGRVRPGADVDLAVEGRHAEVMKLPRLYVVMLRYRVAAMVLLFLLLGAAREGELRLGWRFLFAALALASSYVSATALNDLADEAIDKVNHPRDAGRPLVEGTAGRIDLLVLCIVAAALALAAAVPLGRAAVALIAVALAISQAYSARPLRMSYRVGGAPPALATAYVVVPYSLGILATRGELGHAASLLTLALVLLFGARIVLKDFRDRVGDAQFGKGTILLRFGKTATCTASLAGLLAADGVFGLALDGVLWALVQVFVLAIGWMLWRLWRAEDAVVEQVAIGTGARVGNGLLLSMLAWFVTGGDVAATALVATMFLVSFAPLAARPGEVVVGYKG